MIYRYCAWCKPRSLMQIINDGRPEIMETDGICPECLDKLEGEGREGRRGNAERAFDRTIPLER
jgi:hypothetical protein